jgi:predicted  nucleic acid-binding Zn-ribbon protein
MNYECLACGTIFDESEQTRSDYRDGKCPSCGYDDIKPHEFNVEKELADLQAMREYSRIRG